MQARDQRPEVCNCFLVASSLTLTPRPHRLGPVDHLHRPHRAAAAFGIADVLGCDGAAPLSAFPLVFTPLVLELVPLLVGVVAAGAVVTGAVAGAAAGGVAGLVDVALAWITGDAVLIGVAELSGGRRGSRCQV